MANTNKKIIVAVGANTAEFNKAMAKMNKDMGGVGKAGGELKKALIGAFSVGAITAFGAAAFQAFEDQEKANRKLMFSLNGDEKAFKSLTDQAGRLQSETGIPDETINQIQMLGKEAGLTTSEIKKITEASINLSAATGKDLQSTYEGLIRTLSGNSKALKILGPEFAALTKEQLMNGDAIDLVAKKYGGLAASSALATDKLKAQWGEFMEGVGGGISEIWTPGLTIINDLARMVQNPDISGWDKFYTLMMKWNDSNVLTKQAQDLRDFKEAQDEFFGATLNAPKGMAPGYMLPEAVIKPAKKVKDNKEVKDNFDNLNAMCDDYTKFLDAQNSDYEAGVNFRKRLSDSEAEHFKANHAKITSDLLKNPADLIQPNKTVNTEQFDANKLAAANEELQRMNELSQLAGTAITGLGDAFIRMAETGDVSFKGIVMSTLDGIRSIVNGLLVQALMGQLASNSKFGLPGLAMAAGGMIAVEAIFASMPAFEFGGVVPGNSFTGDNISARLNSGEMVLNTGQQAELFALANGRGGNGAGEEIKLRLSGGDMVGAFKYHNRKIKNTH